MASTPPPVSPDPQNAEWFRWAQDRLLHHEQDIRTSNVRVAANEQQAAATAGQVIANQQTVTEQTRTSAAPTGLMVESNVGSFREDGSAISDVTLSWTRTTTDEQGREAMASEYEVWTKIGNAEPTRATATREPQGTFQLTPGVTATIMVRAKTDTGQWGKFSAGLEIVPAYPPSMTHIPPTAPSLTSAAGLVYPTWNGMLTPDINVVGVPYFQHIITEQAIAASGPWVAVGTPATRAGQTATIRSTPGLSVWVRFRWVDKLGRVSNPSNSANITVASIMPVDVDDVILDAIDQAGEDANNALEQVGNAIAVSLDQYVVTDSSVTPPGPGAPWSEDTPDWEPGQYVWRRQKNTLINGTVSYSAPAVITGNDGVPGADAVLLRVSSTRGTSFKNSAISTVLQVTVFKGSQQITNITDLWEVFGSTAYLEWWWRRIDDTEFGVISSADPRLSQAGFALTVSPSDVDEQTVFQCILQTP